MKRLSLTVGLLMIAADLFRGVPVIAQSQYDNMQGMNWAAASIATTYWPDGLNASQTYAQQYAEGQSIGNAVLHADGATIRMPISTYLATGNNWYLYAGAINGVCSTGCKVILCYWDPNGGTVSNMSAWYQMWDTVTNSFGINDMYLRYEPLNEPEYSSASQLNSLYEGFITRYNPPAWKCILDGNNTATDCVDVGNDSKLNNQYLGLHMYSWFASEPGPGGNGASWQGYYNKCASCVGSYAWRTVITETGVQTDGRSPSVSFWQQWDFSMAPDQAALSGTLAWARDNNVASVAYSGINNGDSYHWFFSTTNLTEVNVQVCDMFRWSWHKAPVSSPLVSLANHKLQNRSDGLFLDNLGSLTAGAGVSQWSSSGSNNQVWTLTQQSSAWYKLENVTSSDFLDGMGSTNNGASVCQWPSSGSGNQVWALEWAGSGSYFKLINESTGQCVDTGGLTTNGSIVQQWSSGQSYNQQWQFE